MGYAESATLHRTWAYTVAHVTFTWWNSHEMVRMRNMFWLWDTHTHFVGHFVLFSASPSHLPCRHFDPRSKTKKRRGDACPYDFALKFICCNRRSWYVLINLLFPFPHKRRSSSLWFWISIWKAVRMCATQIYIYICLYGNVFAKYTSVILIASLRAPISIRCCSHQHTHSHDGVRIQSVFFFYSHFYSCECSYAISQWPQHFGSDVIPCFI